MSELVRLRVRAGVLPRPVQEPPQRPQKPSRRVILVHLDADDSEKVTRAVVVEALDFVPVQILVGAPDDEDLADERGLGARTRQSDGRRHDPGRRGQPRQARPVSGEEVRHQAGTVHLARSRLDLGPHHCRCPESQGWRHVSRPRGLWLGQPADR